MTQDKNKLLAINLGLTVASVALTTAATKYSAIKGVKITCAVASLVCSGLSAFVADKLLEEKIKEKVEEVLKNHPAPTTEEP